MATITTGLGGPQGVGEGSFRGSALTAGNYDDGSIRVNITSVFGPQGINYFGTNYTSIYINTNGLITFAGPQTSYTPSALANLNYPAIAAYWTDINITSGSATGTNNIYWDLDPATGRVTITWLGVRAYQNPSTQGTNTFQVVLQHTHGGNFEIDLIYQQIQWTNGYTGVAQTGMTNGGSADYVLPGSGNASALLTYPNATLDPGEPGGVWSTRFLNGQPVCFVTGTRIAVPGGWAHVEDLRAGDLVLTADHGAQPLRWTGGGAIGAEPDQQPIRIAPGLLGNDHALWVSPRHLLRLEGALCELLFGETEVLAAARDLLVLPEVTQDQGKARIGYHHILMDRHEVIFAEGAGAESLHPGPLALANLPARARSDLEARLSPLDLARLAARPAARRVIKAHEARVWCAAQMRGWGHQPAWRAAA